ncbi:MAG: STAS domain-containing protein [Leptospiraceae bacterium]|nr:STAS domain-containing protein [Leptospiraceae bacterium]
MEVRALESESSLIVYLKGILDTSNSRDLEEYLETRISAGYQKFLLDCSHLESLSSGGISFLLRLSVKMKSNSKIVYILTQMNLEVTKLLRLFGLENRLKIYNNLEEAKSYLARLPLYHSQTKIKQELANPLERKTKQANQIQFYYKGHAKPSSKIRSSTSFDSSENERTSSLVKSQKWKIDAPSPLSSWQKASQISSEKISSLEPIEEQNISSDSPSMLDPLEGKIQEMKSQLSKELKWEVNEGINRILSAIPSNIRSSGESSEANRLHHPETTSSNKNEHPSTKSNLEDKSELVFCEACGTRLRVRDFGKYKCPACLVEFTFNENGSTSFLEKLL